MCFLLPCSLFWQTVSTVSANSDNFTISSLELLRDLSHQTWFTAVEMHCSEHRKKFKIFCDSICFRLSSECELQVPGKTAI